MEGDSTPTRTDDRLGRRQVLKVAGVTGLSAGIAGCVGDDGEDEGGNGNGTDDPGAQNGTESGTDDGTGQPVTDTLRVGVGHSFSQPAWNKWVPAEGFPRARRFVFLKPMYYVEATGEFAPGIVEEYSVDGNVIEFALDDRYTWHDGEPVTAEDLYVQWSIEEYVGHPAWDVIDSVEAADETTFRVALDGEVNLQFLLLQMFRGDRAQVSAPRQVFTEYYEAFEDATTEDEEEAVLSDLLEFRWEEPLGNGAFEFVGYESTSEAQLEAYDEYPHADAINFSQLLFRHAEETQQVVADMQNDRIDARWNLGPRHMDTLHNAGADHWEFRRWPSPGGRHWVFNLDHEWWGNTDVRRGFAYLWNLEEQLAATPGDSANKDVPRLSTSGLADSVADRHLGDVDWHSYYPRESRTEEAIERFEAAGWSQEDDTWYDESGTEVELEVRSPAGVTVMLDRATILQQQNESIGLTTNIEGMEGTTYWEDYEAGANFQLQWAPWGNIIPTQAYEQAIAQPVSEQLHFPAEVSVSEVGDYDGEEAMTVDVQAEMDTIATSQDDAAIQESVRKLSWVWHQEVPSVQLYQGEQTAPVSTTNWDWFTQDSDVTSIEHRIGYAALFGEVAAKTE